GYRPTLPQSQCFWRPVFARSSRLTHSKRSNGSGSGRASGGDFRPGGPNPSTGARAVGGVSEVSMSAPSQFAYVAVEGGIVLSSGWLRKVSSVARFFLCNRPPSRGTPLCDG